MAKTLDEKMDELLSNMVTKEDIEGIKKSIEKMEKKFDDKFYIQERQLGMIANSSSDSNDFLDGLNLAAATGGKSRLVNPFYTR